MKRMIVAVLIMAMMCAALLVSRAEEMPQQTTDKEILFQGMSWNTDYKEAEQIVKNAFPEIDDVHRQTSWINDSVWNFYDGGYVLPRYNSTHIDSMKIEFQEKGPWSGTYMPFGKVAGYNIDKIWLKFIKKTALLYSLYEAGYQFDTLGSYSTIPTKDQYSKYKGVHV